jgi:hypothetical protein
MSATSPLRFWKICRAGIAPPSTRDRPVTGWVTRDGTVNFREDVYKHDDTLDRDALADVAAGGLVAHYAIRSWRSGKTRISTPISTIRLYR